MIKDIESILINGFISIVDYLDINNEELLVMVIVEMRIRRLNTNIASGTLANHI